MNVAARIESHGAKGKIHVSLETAKELIKCGMSKILVEREQKIHAKGKGYLQTYFLSNDFIHCSKRRRRMDCTSSETNSSSNNSQSTFTMGSSTSFVSRRHSLGREEESSSSMGGGADDLPYATSTLTASFVVDGSSSQVWT